MSAAPNTSTIELWASWEGHVVNGVYPLRRCLGSSDHSGVFLTEARKATPNDLAIKIVPAIPADAEVQLSRWLTAGDLDHPSLVSIFEAGRCQVDGRPYLYAVMEYADQDLGQLLQRRALSEDEVREMLMPALTALGFLHQRKFVQGRVKPSNILVVGDQLKLASDTICRVGEAVDSGGPLSAYESPEVRETGRSAAGDIWALGVTICEALTRRQPLALHAGGNPVFPVDLSPAFRELAGWCLSRRAADRPEVSELEASLRGERTVPIAIPAVEPSLLTELVDDTDSTTPSPAVAPVTPAAEATTPPATTEVTTPPAATEAATPAVVAEAAAPAAAPSAPMLASTPAAEATATKVAPATPPAVPTAPSAASSPLPSEPSTSSTVSSAPLSPPGSIAAAAASLRGSIEVAVAPPATVPAPPTLSAPPTPTSPSASALPVATAQAAAEVARAVPPASATVAAREVRSTAPAIAPQAARPSYTQTPSAKPATSEAHAGNQPKPRYLMGAAAFTALLVVAWGVTKLLSDSPNDAQADSVADVAASGASSESSSGTDDAASDVGADEPASEAVADGDGSSAARVAPAASARVASAGSTAATRDVRSASVAPSEWDSAVSVVNEVMPDVPNNARRTIRGRVRVSVRVIVEKDGTVFAALADNPGPSRYFERLAIDAAKKWTFAPTESDEERLMLVRFVFERQGTTATATAVR